LNAPELLDGDVNGPFEVRDTFASLAAENAFGTAVTRTYTLRVRVGVFSAFSSCSPRMLTFCTLTNV
jgi:hypothetical protein